MLIYIQVSDNLSVTFMPPLKTNYNMSCRLGGSPIPTVIETDNIQCSIQPSDDRSMLSCNVSANLIIHHELCVIYQ